MQQTLNFDATKEDFNKWIADNPQVYDFVVAKAREWKRAGHSKAGVRMFWELARWDAGLKTTTSKPKLQDHYSAPLARLIMEREADLQGFFEIRERAK